MHAFYQYKNLPSNMLFSLQQYGVGEGSKSVFQRTLLKNKISNKYIFKQTAYAFYVYRVKFNIKNVIKSHVIETKTSATISCIINLI